MAQEPSTIRHKIFDKMEYHLLFTCFDICKIFCVFIGK